MVIKKPTKAFSITVMFTKGKQSYPDS